MHPFFYNFIINKKYSIGTILKLDCHVGKQKKNLKVDVEELPLHQLELLRLRTNIGGEFSEVVKNICSNHRYCFISDFSNSCRKCVDSLSIHKTSVKTSLHEITLEEHKQFCARYRILPGQKICFWCKNKIFVKNVDSV